MIMPAKAPVLIFTYDRLQHLKSTIASLRSNIHADQTDLFIASDFHRDDADSNKVAAVRNYLKGVDGFKSVTIFEREENFGAAKNCFSALESILNIYERFILMEDDIVTAPGFLEFMNQAFEKYGSNERVFSITGYCPPIDIPSSYRYDAFFLGRMNAWGCGFTKDRYESVRKIDREEFDGFVANKKLSRQFALGGGEDLLVMLKDVAYGSLEAWDVRCMYTQFMNNQYTVYPTQSLVQNIGHDGSGIHCVRSDRFDVKLSDKTKFLFPDDVVVDKRIVRANLNFRDGSTSERLYARILRLRARLVRKIRRAIKLLLGREMD